MNRLVEPKNPLEAIIKTGTKSLLFGAHHILIHPIFVAAAWTRLYGFPRDPRLHLCFFVHDLGYWRLERLDDEAGERHVEFGANLMGRLFGPPWRDLCLYHSRYYAQKQGEAISRLCVADKLAMLLEPAWLYLPRVLASGEVWEIE